MIWFDRTQRTVLVGCHTCGTREIHASQAAADQWVSDHVARVHPNDPAGRVASDVIRRRARADRNDGEMSALR